jgi:outer membrane lipoprotein SlyB
LSFTAILITRRHAAIKTKRFIMKFPTPFSSSSRKGALLIAAFVTSMASAPMAVQAQPRDHGCRDCGTVVSSRTVERAEKGSGLGAGAGAVVGGLLGNQIGSGGGRTLATVAGAVGGAYAGNSIERSRNTKMVTETRVRMNDGSIRTFTDQGSYRKGAQVRVDHGRLERR